MRGLSSASDGTCVGCEPVARMQCSNCRSVVSPSAPVTVIDFGPVSVARPWTNLHLAHLRDTGRRPPVSLSTTPCLKARSLSTSSVGSPKVTPQRGGVLRLVDHLGDVQQGLRRDAAAIQADAAGVLLLVDERDLHAQIGRVETRRHSRPVRRRGPASLMSCRCAISRCRDRRKGCSIASTTQRGSAWRRRRRSRDGRTTATAAASAAARTGRVCHTGSMPPRDTPRIATSGQLTIGVKSVPPMPPRFEMLMPPPLISSRVSLRSRAFSASCCSSTAICGDVLLVGVADHRHEQAVFGVHRDADVDVLLVDDARRARGRARR